MGTDQLNCPHCQAAVARPDRYCPSCGYALSKRCSNCSETLHFSEQYCKQCGTRAVGSERANGEALAAVPPSPGHAGAVHGPAQNAFATILFLDIKGSSSMIEALDPEGAANLLDEIHERFTRYIRRFGGSIVAFQGDGFQAIFGAPEMREDHATRALLAALAIREEVARQPEGQRLTVRIGIHSGDVFTRTVATDFAPKFDAMGLTVHIAKRLEEAAKDNSIHISYVTFNLTRHQFDFESLGTIGLRGLTHKMQTFRVLGFRRTPETVAVGDAQRGSIVGREFELAALSRSLSLALNGRPQISVLLGEAGIGKSRLAVELAEMARAQGATVVIHEEVMQGLARSYASLSRLLRVLEKVAQGDPGQAGDGVSYDRPDLVYSQDPAEPSQPTASTDVGEELRSGLLTTIERLASRRLLVLVIDDAQWMDAESLDIVIQGISQDGDLRLLVLICARGFGLLPKLGDAANVNFIRVGPLGPEECSALFRSLARPAKGTSRLEPTIATLTGGNPLFIEELALAASSGDLARAGASEPNGQGEIDPGGRIKSIVLDRVQQLDGQARLLLQCAALIESDCTQDLLAEVAGLADGTRASAAVNMLLASGFLRRSLAGERTLLGMRHSLLRQIVERSIVRFERRRLHGRIRDVLGGEGKLNVLPEFLAHHATLAEDWARASDDWREAGMRALDASVYGHAASCFERALEATARESDNAQRSERQDAIRMLMRLCLAPMGEYTKLYYHLNQVSHDETLPEDAGSRLALLLSLAHVETICGNVRLSRRKALEARRLAEAAGQRGACIAATYFLAQALEFAADYADCIALASTTLDDLLRSERHERFQLTGTATVLFASLRAHANAFRNNAAAAERDGRLAVEIAEETQRPFDLGVAHFGLGWSRFILGDLARAKPSFELALAHVKDQRLLLLESMIDCRLRYLRIVVGGEAVDAVNPEQACQEASEMPHIWSWSSLLWAMAEVHRGNLDRATRIVSDTIRVARANHYRGVSAWANCVLADIKYRSNAASRHAIGRRARQLAEKTGLAWKFEDAEWMRQLDGGAAAPTSPLSETARPDLG